MSKPTIEELEALIEEHGAAGVRLGPDGNVEILSEIPNERERELLAAAKELAHQARRAGWDVTLHPDDTRYRAWERAHIAIMAYEEPDHAG